MGLTVVGPNAASGSMVTGPVPAFLNRGMGNCSPRGLLVRRAATRARASRKIVGGGQSTTVTIPVAKLKAGESYTYICTFPGHSSIMRGTLTVK